MQINLTRKLTIEELSFEDAMQVACGEEIAQTATICNWFIGLTDAKELSDDFYKALRHMACYHPNAFKAGDLVRPLVEEIRCIQSRYQPTNIWILQRLNYLYYACQMNPEATLKIELR